MKTTTQLIKRAEQFSQRLIAGDDDDDDDENDDEKI